MAVKIKKAVTADQLQQSMIDSKTYTDIQIDKLTDNVAETVTEIQQTEADLSDQIDEALKNAKEYADQKDDVSAQTLRGEIRSEVETLNTAIADAVREAKDYADGQDEALETKLTGAMSTMRGEVEAYAVAKAEDAEKNAKDYADTKDADVKQQAISLATAQAASYTDQRELVVNASISALQTTLEEEIADAEKNARDYADGKDTVVLANAYADAVTEAGKVRTELGEKETALKAEIASAEKNAKDYADDQDDEIKLTVTQFVKDLQEYFKEGILENVGAVMEEVEALQASVADINSFETELCTGMPSDPKAGIIYFVPHEHDDDDAYDEYMLINGSLEKIGHTDLDLSAYELPDGLKTGYVLTGLKSGVTAGSKATAEGEDTQATGYASNASGVKTVANHEAQTAIGVLNAIDDQNSTYGKYALMIGNGYMDGSEGEIERRSNAMTVEWTGDITAGKYNNVDVPALETSVNTLTEKVDAINHNVPVVKVLPEDADVGQMVILESVDHYTATHDTVNFEEVYVFDSIPSYDTDIRPLFVNGKSQVYITADESYIGFTIGEDPRGGFMTFTSKEISAAEEEYNIKGVQIVDEVPDQLEDGIVYIVRNGVSRIPYIKTSEDGFKLYYPEGLKTGYVLTGLADGTTAGTAASANGYNNASAGNYSFTVGTNNKANSIRTFVGGDNSKASYEGSFVFGDDLQDATDHQVIFGTKNMPSHELALSIGGGYGLIQKNIFNVYKSGNVWSSTGIYNNVDLPALKAQVDSLESFTIPVVDEFPTDAEDGDMIVYYRNETYTAYLSWNEVPLVVVDHISNYTPDYDDTRDSTGMLVFATEDTTDQVWVEFMTEAGPKFTSITDSLYTKAKKYQCYDNTLLPGIQMVDTFYILHLDAIAQTPYQFLNNEWTKLVPEIKGIRVNGTVVQVASDGYIDLTIPTIETVEEGGE